MATKNDERGRLDERDERNRKTRDTEPAHEGDVLGLSDADPNVQIPVRIKPGGGSPQGIDVREHASGIGDISQSSGATGVDMGHGGEGTGVSSEPSRPRSAPDEEDEK